MNEFAPVAQDPLDALEDFMAVTSDAIRVQSETLRTFGPWISEVDRSRYTQSIQTESAANVAAVRAHVLDMAATGLHLVVRTGNQSTRIEAFALDPNSGRYLAGITTDNGRQMVPLLDGSSALAIDRYLQMPKPRQPVYAGQTATPSSSVSTLDTRVPENLY